MRTIEDINKLLDYVKDNPINFTWTNPKTSISISTIPNSGNGRFAIDDIESGEIIAILSGIILSEDEYQQVRKRFSFASGLLIHKDFKLLQLNSLSENNGSLNHCCDPNATLNGQVMIKATRDIGEGEELFIDYGIIANQDLVFFDECKCGAWNCRKYVTAKDWLSSSFRLCHGNDFSYHLLQLIRNTNPKEMINQLLNLKKIDVTKSIILSDELRKYEKHINK